MTAVEWLMQTLEQNNIIDLDCIDSDKYYTIIEQAKEIEKQEKTKLLSWLKENNWHLYKDGTWYTLNEKPYTQGKQRKYYTEDEVVKIFSNELPIYV